jgi:23S rRNA (cytosine1962-C5)-methyltransferase
VAHRLAWGAGGWVERLGDDVLISYKTEAGLAQMARGLDEWTVADAWQPRRVFTRYMPLKNAERVSPKLRSGDAGLPLTSVVREAGVRYGVDYGAGYSQGLFLDQRGNRAVLRNLKPKRLLNTFAYTCSFSVVAGLGGGATVSVDLSQKSLDRGRQNFELNAVPLGRHSFIADDASALLPKLASRGERFDAIILDPPTFSRSPEGRLWQVEQNFEELVLGALGVAGPKCAVLLSTNATKLNSAELEKRARTCVKLRRRAVDFVRLKPAVDFPAGQGASTVWMMLR